MDTKNIERNDGKVSFQVVVDAAAFEAAVNKVYLRSRGRIMIPGFRKGKAPRAVIEGMYGKDVFYEEAVDSMALDAFKAGIAEAGDRTVGDPAITDYNVDDDHVLTITFESSLYPEVTLGEYKGLTAYKAPVEVSDEDVQKEVETVQKRNARIVAVEREAKQGDTVNIDFDGYKDGKRFDGGKAEGYSLTLGSGSFVPGFEEQLIGTKAGEETEVNITFPEDYAPELAGADVVFKVRVNEVQETQLPDLDDEFAKDVSEFDTLDEYKESIRKILTARREESAENEYHNRLIEKAVKNMTAEVPAPMIDSRVNDMLDDMSRRCMAQGLSLKQYLSMMGLDEQTYRAFVRPSAENSVRSELMLEKVAETEKIEVTPEDIEAEYKASAEKLDIDLERLKTGVPENVIAQDLKNRRAMDLIFAAGVATDVPDKTEEDEEAKPAGEAAEEAPAAEETTEKKPAAKRRSKKAAPEAETEE